MCWCVWHRLTIGALCLDRSTVWLMGEVNRMCVSVCDALDESKDTLQDLQSKFLQIKQKYHTPHINHPTPASMNSLIHKSFSLQPLI